MDRKSELDKALPQPPPPAQAIDTALRALAAYGSTDGASVTPLGEGLINETYLVERPAREKAVLQRVSPIFARAVHDDIEAITAHLQVRGLVTPRLYRTHLGELSVDLGSDGIWRLMNFICGQSHGVMTKALAAPAGALVGRFHAALIDLPHQFHFVRTGAHDLGGHLARLARVSDVAARSNFVPPEAAVPQEFFALAQALIRYGETLPLSLELPLRLCHGDLKASNLRFDDSGEGICLLDLDTLAYLPLAFELGDALRSWCNRRGEDVTDSEFDLEIFEEALRGYARPSATFLTPAEKESLVFGTLRITFQLAVRFAVDVVEQKYFRWNNRRFASRAAHNFVRVTGQWRLCQSLLAVRSRAEAIAARVFAQAAGGLP